ncbi:MAG TPA: fructose-bisphosphatase class III, partial [Myxococcota bacterium]
RSLLRFVDKEKGTVTIDGKVHNLRDPRLPTLDPAHPDQLTDDEQRCIDRLKQSFLASPQLWRHMQFIRGRGSMLLTRDHNLIFHGCVPVDEKGVMLSYPIDGQPLAGKALLDGFERVVHRAFREKRQKDLDLLWYLWTGAKSPLFGKDRMATFEGYFVEDEAAKKENKNPYFKLANDTAFCDSIFHDFGADPTIGFIVNGHVPVKVEKGEEPLKKSGRAVTIDGAFSEAYGDRGYTLILNANRTSLAEHHHFDSVAAAVASGADIVPKVTDLRTFKTPRLVKDTETGTQIQKEIGALEDLIAAYEDNRLVEDAPL